MKFLVVIAIVFTYAQAEEADPFKLAKEMQKVIPVCAQEHGLDVNKVNEQLKQINLPEDDQKFTDFFICYHVKVGLFKPNGQADKEKLAKELPQLIRLLFGESVDAFKLAEKAGEHCKDTPEASSDAITTMRLRACVFKYVLEHKD